jgi:hypothetical protein
MPAYALAALDMRFIGAADQAGPSLSSCAISWVEPQGCNVFARRCIKRPRHIIHCGIAVLLGAHSYDNARAGLCRPPPHPGSTGNTRHRGNRREL